MGSEGSVKSCTLIQPIHKARLHWVWSINICGLSWWKPYAKEMHRSIFQTSYQLWRQNADRVNNGFILLFFYFISNTSTQILLYVIFPLPDMTIFVCSSDTFWKQMLSQITVSFIVSGVLNFLKSLFKTTCPEFENQPSKDAHWMRGAFFSFLNTRTWYRVHPWYFFAKEGWFDVNFWQ